MKHTGTHTNTDTPLLMVFDKVLVAVKLINDVFNLYCVGNTQPKSLWYLHIFLSTFSEAAFTSHDAQAATLCKLPHHRESFDY